MQEKLGGSGEASITFRGRQFWAGLRAELGYAVGNTGGAARRPGCWSTGKEGEGQGQRDRDGDPKSSRVPWRTREQRETGSDSGVFRIVLAAIYSPGTNSGPLRRLQHQLHQKQVMSWVRLKVEEMGTWSKGRQDGWKIAGGTSGRKLQIIIFKSYVCPINIFSHYFFYVSPLIIY